LIIYNAWSLSGMIMIEISSFPPYFNNYFSLLFISICRHCVLEHFWKRLWCRLLFHNFVLYSHAHIIFWGVWDMTKLAFFHTWENLKMLFLKWKTFFFISLKAICYSNIFLCCHFYKLKEAVNIRNISSKHQQRFQFSCELNKLSTTSRR
jgi:hypothetical protein